jgi:hypothetical protein
MTGGSDRENSDPGGPADSDPEPESPGGGVEAEPAPWREDARTERSRGYE